MAGSKKDKFRKAADSRLEKATREEVGMEELVEDIDRDRRSSEQSPPEKKEDRERNLISEDSAAPYNDPESAVPENAAEEKTPRESRNEENLKDGPEAKGGEEPSPRFSPSRGAMARSRESIYNVSSDMRLEDYTEVSSGGGFGLKGKVIAGLLALGLLIWLGYAALGLLFAPSYTLSISAGLITEENAVRFSRTEVVAPSPGGAVHIRFQWNEGELPADLLRITAEKKIGDKYMETASKSRRPPVTANYMYFINVLEPGRYRVQVRTRDGKLLKEKSFQVR